MRFILTVFFSALMATAANAEFKISFQWGDIPSCTSGRPNVVGSPAFVIKGLPEGTNNVQFKLKDLNVPGFNHGGGKVKISQDGQLPFGVFKYKSPCPPNGVHKYQWTATARKGNKKLATAAAARNYPE